MKIMSEKALLANKNDIFRPTILRLGTVFGPSLRNRFDLVVNRFLAFGLKKKQITIFGEKNWRPLVSVNDVVKSIILVLRSPKKKVQNTIFNVGSSKENFTIGHIAKVIKKISRCKLNFIPGNFFIM